MQLQSMQSHAAAAACSHMSILYYKKVCRRKPVTLNLNLTRKFEGRGFRAHRVGLPCTPRNDRCVGAEQACQLSVRERCLREDLAGAGERVGAEGRADGSARKADRAAAHARRTGSWVEATAGEGEGRCQWEREGRRQRTQGGQGPGLRQLQVRGRGGASWKGRADGGARKADKLL
eukprot:361532-Chlamydomonas_euryale.AAC.4